MLHSSYLRMFVYWGVKQSNRKCFVRTNKTCKYKLKPRAVGLNVTVWYPPFFAECGFLSPSSVRRRFCRLLSSVFSTYAGWNAKSRELSWWPLRGPVSIFRYLRRRLSKYWISVTGHSRDQLLCSICLCSFSCLSRFFSSWLFGVFFIFICSSFLHLSPPFCFILFKI